MEATANGRRLFRRSGTDEDDDTSSFGIHSNHKFALLLQNFDAWMLGVLISDEEAPCSLPRWDFAVNLRYSSCRALMNSKFVFVPVFIGLHFFAGCAALTMKQRCEPNAKSLAEGKDVTHCVKS
jgi:hypothetical protein